MTEDAILELSPTTGADAPIDLVFLAIQTFADLDLQDEVLDLFVAQARRLLPGLPALDATAQGDIAHLLKGSARGIGAWAAAGAAEAYEAADAAGRIAVFPRLAAAFAAVETAVQARRAARLGAQATI